MRAHVGVALLRGSDEPLRELKRALRGRTSLVVIDGADALTTAELTQAAGMLRDAVSVTVIVSATDPAMARALLTEAGRFDVPTLDLSRASALSSLEVNA